jgi:hypothetical protein
MVAIQPLTPSQRVDDLKAAAHQFSKCLIETPGVVLTAELRWAVAVCARDALVDCPGCCTLGGHDVCLLPGASFRVIADLNHKPSFPVRVSSEAEDVLRNLVHAVVNHQSKTDSKWHDGTVKAIGGLKFVPDKFAGESRISLLHSLFCEAVALTCVSHSTSISFLALGQETPPLPVLEDMKDSPKPLMLDMTTILRKGRGLRRDPLVGFIPHVEFNDFEPRLLRERFPADFVKSLQANFKMFAPMFGVSFSPQDLVMCCKLNSTCHEGKVCVSCIKDAPARD